jgi:membrane-anchored glycerophosphoryl diester phosphodiesterase (GDPDase)
MFNLGLILKEGFEALKRNYVLAVPTVIAALVKVILGSFIIISTEAIAVMLIIGLAGLVIDYFAHGVALAMAREVLEKGETSLKTGIDVASSFLFHFLVTSILLSVIVGAGLMLILPGLAAMFVLMFTFPSIIMHGLTPSEAIRNSYNLIRSNFSDSLLLFAVLAAIIIAITVVSLMFAAIPVLGQFIGVVLNGAMGGFSALVLLRAYIIFGGGLTEETQEES